MASTSPEPTKRSLPKRLNPLLAPDETPPHDELIAKRRLGQTNLTVKPAQVGTSSATKRENLGQFDYAHLRAPLPKNLKGSEIFAPQRHQPHPEAYFLMRRSSDGFISATGMFKLAFPWAQHSEEQAERDYIKSLPASSQDEVAGNVWISERFALELAEDYSIQPWIVALLDPAPVKNPDGQQKSISSPPVFKIPAKDKTNLPLSKETNRASTPGRGRGRPRASTPSKGATPSTKNGSPRKQRTTKASKEANAAAAREANASLQDALDKSAEAADSDAVNGEKPTEDEKSTEDNKPEDKRSENQKFEGLKSAAEKKTADKRSTADKQSEGKKPEDRKSTEGRKLTDDKKAVLKVVSETVVNGTEETTSTGLEFEFPGGMANVPVPENPEQMIADAQAMVDDALKIDGGRPGSSKRKAEEMDEDSDEDSLGEQPAKRAKLLEEKLKTERVRNRAMLGVTATLIASAIIPYWFA